MVSTVLKTNESLTSSHKMCWRWKGNETNPTSLTLLKGIFSISCCFSSCSRLWGFSGDPGRDWQKMSFTGEALNLPSKVRTCHCETCKYSNQLSALSFWLCHCPGGAGASLDESPKGWGTAQGRKKGHWTWNLDCEPCDVTGQHSQAATSTLHFLPRWCKGGMMILCVYFRCLLLVASNPSRPSLWKEAAAPDFILIQQQNNFPVHFLCFFPTATEA